ncbi:MAG: hypothetical protein WC726_01550 [Parcubacteria group bacterium]|jgi:hypothetical protein
MGDFLQSIAAFVASLFTNINAEAQRTKNALVITFLGAASVYLTQLIFDNMNLTMTIAIAWDTLILWKWFDVRRMVVAAGVGETIEKLGMTPPPGATEVVGRIEVPKLNVLFDLYISVALYAVFWMHVICFFAPLLSLREYPWFGVFLLFGGTAYLIMYPKGAILRKTLVWGIVIALILMFLRLISPAGWIKGIGFDPFWAMRVNATDKALAEVLQEQDKVQDALGSKRLKGIQQKVKEHKPLSPEEKRLLNDKNQGLLQKAIGPLGSSGKTNNNIYGQIDPLLDIDISASKRADATGNDIVVAPGGCATFKFFVKNPPSGTKRESVVIRITLKPSASKYLYFTVNGRKYEAFLDGFGRKSLGITSDMLTDINTLTFEGDSNLIINGKENMTVAKS